MTNTTSLKDQDQTHNSNADSSSNYDTGDVLQLKRLLVSLKNQYEKNLQALNSRLQEAIVEKQTLQNEFEDLRKIHEEELQALKLQQMALRDHVKKSQEEVKQLREAVNDPSDQHQLEAQQQKIEQLERVLPYLRERTEEAHLETEQLREELEEAYKKINALQADLSINPTHGEQTQNPDLARKQLELQLLEKNNLITKMQKQAAKLEEKLVNLNNVNEEKNDLHERYEQLREESSQLSERLESALDMRVRAEQQLDHLVQLTKEQESTLIEQNNQLADLKREKDYLQNEIQQLRVLLEENEGRLKMAQQHLAKKVKEAALLTEKLEEQHITLTEQQQRLEIAKGQLSQMQTNVDIYQKQEKKLQEQLHDALKSTESQVAKWEEKYFKMYDKWQESEANIRELKKFEDKYQQMQSLLSNLGSFMGSSFTSSPFFHNAVESEKTPVRPLPVEMPPEPIESPKADNTAEERYDVFGMKLPQDKYKSNPFS